MISKNKSIIVLICILLFSFTNVNAAKKRGVYATKNLEGQNTYLKRCSSCHGEGSRGGNMASIREWKVMFSQNAEELKDLHIDDEENLSVIKYIESNDFKKEEELMLKFLQEFAYDSEHIPTCN